MLAVVAYVFETSRPSPAGPPQVIASAGGVAAGGSISHSPITIYEAFHGLGDEELVRLAKACTDAAAVGTAERDEALVRAGDLAAEIGVSRDVLVSFFRIVRRKSVPQAEYSRRLVDVALAFGNLQHSLVDVAAIDPGARELVAQAARELEAARFDAADEALERAAWVERAMARQIKGAVGRGRSMALEHLLSAAADVTARGRIAEMLLRYGDAAERYAEAASILPEVDDEGVASYKLGRVLDEADARYAQGMMDDDKKALQQAVELYRSVFRTRSFVRLEGYAVGQANLGSALIRLAAADTGNGVMEEAVKAFREALSQRAIPLDQSHRLAASAELGDVLVKLGRAQEGVEVYREAERICAACMRDKGQAWMEVRIRLASALASSAVAEAKLILASEATVVASEVLKTAEREPTLEARARVVMAFATSVTGDLAGRPGQILDGIAVLQMAVRDLSPEGDREARLTAQHYLAWALEASARHGGGRERLRDAGGVYEDIARATDLSDPRMAREAWADRDRVQALLLGAEGPFDKRELRR